MLAAVSVFSMMSLLILQGSYEAKKRLCLIKILEFVLNFAAPVEKNILVAKVPAV